MRTRTHTIYITEDGREFDTEEEALEVERRSGSLEQRIKNLPCVLSNAESPEGNAYQAYGLGLNLYIEGGDWILTSKWNGKQERQRYDNTSGLTGELGLPDLLEYDQIGPFLIHLAYLTLERS